MTAARLNRVFGDIERTTQYAHDYHRTMEPHALIALLRSAVASAKSLRRSDMPYGEYPPRS